MKTNKNSSRARTRAHRALSLLTAAVLLMPNIPMPSTVFAASSWSPTLLVNTESFQQIDAGDSTTDVALRFGSSTSSLSLLTTGIFRFTKSVSVQGGLSGSYLTIDHQANISGSLVVKQNAAVKGSLSGATFFGAGLGDCSNTTTSKLIYNPTTGRFSCATDQSGGTSGGGLGYGSAEGIFVNQGGDTMTGALTIVTSQAHTATGALNVVEQTNATGAYIKSTTNKEPALAIDIAGTSNAPHLLFGYQGTFDTNLYRKSADLLKTDDSFFAVGTISGSRLRVDGAADIHGALTASGSVRTDGDLTINDDRSSGDAVLTFGNTTANQTLKFLATSQKFEFSKDLRVVGSISGASLRVDGTTTIHGSLSASGAVHFDSNLSINDDQSAADAILTFGNATLNQDLKFLNTEQRFQFSTNLNVVGSISGRTLAVSGASSFSGASLFRTSVTAKGALSGATLFGAGLGDCSNSTTSKLIYNPTTGRFSCATDQTGGSTGGGMSYTDIHNIFVDQAGDTMTGALIVDILNGAQGSIGINARNTVSGAVIRAQKTLASSGSLSIESGVTSMRNIQYTWPSASGSSGDVLKINPATGELAWGSPLPKMVISTANTSDSTAGGTNNISDISIPVAASTNYIIECMLTTNAAATTTGVQITVNGPASPTQLTWRRRSCSSTTAIVNAQINAFGTEDARTASAGTTRCNEELFIHLRNGTNGGNVTLSLDTEVGASAVTSYAGSYCTYREY